MNLSKYDYTERKARETEEAAKTSRTDKPEAAPSAPAAEGPTLFGRRFSEKEQKSLFLYLIIGIVLAELAVTVGAIVISITNAQPSSTGVPHFRFPWLGYLVAVVMVPVLAMLLVNLVSLGFSRDARGGEADLEGVPQRLQTFYALVRGAPTVILFAGFVLMGAAIYYLDGVMALLLKLGEHFHLVAIWIVGGFAAAWTVSYVVRAWMHYKTRQMEAEYAFRHEVLERTGMVILDTKYAPTTDLRMLPAVPGAPGGPSEAPALDVTAALPASAGSSPEEPAPTSGDETAALPEETSEPVSRNASGESSSTPNEKSETEEAALSSPEGKSRQPQPS